jgi:hypothetical protein
MSGGRPRRFLHVFAPAIGAINRAPSFHIQIDERVAERAATAVAPDDGRLNLDDFMRIHAQRQLSTLMRDARFAVIDRLARR